MAVRNANPRAYEPDAQTAGEMPLQTLLALVYLNQQLRASADPPTDGRAERLSSIVSALYDIATGQSSLDEVLAYVVEAARAGTEASASVIALREGEQFVCCARSGPNAPDLGARLNPQTGISGECIRTGAIMRCDETWTDMRVNVAVCRRLRVRSMIAVPIHHRRKITGVLEVLSDRPGAFGDQQTITLQLLSSLITHALQNEEAAREEGVNESTAPAQQQASATATQTLIPGGVPNPSPSGEGSSTATLSPESGSSAADIAREVLELAAQTIEPASPAASTAEASRTLLELAPLETTSVSPLTELTPSKDASSVNALRLQQQPSPAVAETPLAPLLEPAPAQSADLATLSEPVAPELFTALTVAQERNVGTLRVAIVAAAAVLVLVLCAVVFLRHSKAAPPLAIAQPASTPAPVPPQPAAGPAQLSAINVQSNADSTTINIKLGRKVEFKSDKLHNPDRVYFDLEDTQLDNTFTTEAQARVGVYDARVAQVRVAQTQANVTRVVLDLKCPCDYSAALPDTAPADLSIVVRRPATGSPAMPQSGAAITSPATVPIAAPSTPALRPTALPARMVVVLDAGHGGPDLGTVGPNGLQEKDLSLDIAQRLGKLLRENLGAEVLFTRSDDSFVSLEARSAMANQARADLVLSIHANSASDSSARGVETFYFPSAPQAAAVGTPVSIATEAATRRLANVIQRNLHGALGREDARIRNRGVKHANFVLLTNAEVPAVLTEVAFLSSPSDERKLLFAPARDTIAAALYRGIAEFFRNSTRRTRPQVRATAAHSALDESPLHGSAPVALQ